MKSTCVVVIGLPRSGTSAVAGVLSRLGVFMGPQTAPPDSSNPEGYYEDATIVMSNVRATGANTFYDMVITSLNVMGGCVFRIENKVDRQLYKMVIEGRSDKHRFWGVKDPRFCFPNLLKDFIELVQEKSRVKIIGTKRPISHVVSSVKSKFDLHDSHNHELRDLDDMEIFSYLSYLDGAKDQMLRDFIGNASIVRFDDLIDNTESTVNGIARFVGVRPNQRAIDFIRPELRRYSDV